MKVFFFGLKCLIIFRFFLFKTNVMNDFHSKEINLFKLKKLSYSRFKKKPILTDYIMATKETLKKKASEHILYSLNQIKMTEIIELEFKRI